MTNFHATVRITLKKGVLDPQGKAISNALEHMGHQSVASVRQGKLIELELQEKDEASAQKSVAQMCEKLLANTVIEDYAIEIAAA
jgi:phosphoribosylformylglycinamidine synthase